MREEQKIQRLMGIGLFLIGFGLGMIVTVELVHIFG